MLALCLKGEQVAGTLGTLKFYALSVLCLHNKYHKFIPVHFVTCIKKWGFSNCLMSHDIMLKS